jgi:hypothetical protein
MRKDGHYQDSHIVQPDAMPAHEAIAGSAQETDAHANEQPPKVFSHGGFSIVLASHQMMAARVNSRPRPMSQFAQERLLRLAFPGSRSSSLSSTRLCQAKSSSFSDRLLCIVLFYHYHGLRRLSIPVKAGMRRKIFGPPRWGPWPCNGGASGRAFEQESPNLPFTASNALTLTVTW